MAVLIMLSNYFHDLATAVFAVSAVTAWLLLRAFDGERPAAELRDRVVRPLVRVAWGALAWTLLAGVPRALAFRRYEWMEAAGRAQIPALVVKHVILVSLVLFGAVVLARLHRTLRQPLEVTS